jgi:cell division protein FtsW
MSTITRFLLFLSVVSLFALGLVMIFNTTSAEVLDHALSKNTHQVIFKQIIFASLGILIARAVYMIGYQRLIQWSPILLGLFTLLLILVLLPGIGREVNGSKRWISLFGFSFQPSEFVKYWIPAYLIFRLSSIDEKKLSFKSFTSLIGLVSIPMILILIEPNNGTVAVVGLLVLVLCVLSEIPFKYWATPLLALILIGGASASQLPYFTARIKVYLNPELDLRGKGHQPYQAKIAAGSGEWTGRGPGNSLQKLSYLPEAQNDYIAAIYAEEFGFIGILFLIVLYMIIAYVGFTIAFQATDKEGFYLGAITTFLISFQAFMNLGVVSGILPSTGLNLPFFSQGGTSLMANMMGIGILITIAEGKKTGEKKEGWKNK